MPNDNKKKKITITEHTDPPVEPVQKKKSKIAVTMADDDGLLQVSHSGVPDPESAPEPADANPAVVAAPKVTKSKSIAVNMIEEPDNAADSTSPAATEVHDEDSQIAAYADMQPVDTDDQPIADQPDPQPAKPDVREPIGPPELPVGMTVDDDSALDPATVTEPNDPLAVKATRSIAVMHDDTDEPIQDLPDSFMVVDGTAPLVPDEKTVLEPVPPRPSLSTSRPTLVPATADKSLPDALNDAATEHAVEDILSKESDELLAVQDRRALGSTLPARSKQHRMFSLRSLLHRAAVWRALVLMIAGVLGILGAMPQTRYAALNTVGVRAGASVRVVDESTQQPLRHVRVTLAGVTVDTDEAGNAQFQKLPLGKTTLTIEKRAFAPITEPRTLGWGSNPLGERRIKPMGSQYDIVATDFLSAKPIASASITAGDADANADDKGQIKLTMEHSDVASFEATVKAPGYREEKLTINADFKQQVQVKLVPDRQHFFVSQRSGKYDLYKVDVDGKNEAVLLAGTGRERSDVALASHPGANVTALVSTRDDKHNDDGYLLSTLTVVNGDDGSTNSVVQSEQVSMSGWVGDRLIYVQIVAGTSAANPSRQRLMSYDYKTRDNKQLASANYFNDVLVANGKVYYAPSSAYQASNTNGLYRVNADGGNSQTIINQETWNLFRTDYNKIAITIPNQWYEFAFDATSATKLDVQPSNTNSRIYVDSPDGKLSAWLDKRDGKGVLLLRDIDGKTDKALQTKSGLVGPVRWLNNSSLVYRIHTEQETADYALSIDNETPIKIGDVTPTGSVDRWYYY